MTTNSPLEGMHKVFRDQHQAMIEEQKKLLDNYKHYFDGMLQNIEDQVNAMNPPPPPPPKTEEEKIKEEIAEIGALLDDAVKTYGKELADILAQLAERQKKRVESSLTGNAVEADK
jgi:CHASE3 domain sensor protein